MKFRHALNRSGAGYAATCSWTLDSNPIRRIILTLIVAVTCSGLALSAETKNQDSELNAVISPIIKDYAGRVSIAIKHLPSGTTFRYQAEEPMPTASLIKFPVMIAAYDKISAGALSLDKELTLRAEDKVPGSGILTSHFSDGATLSLKDAIQLMIAFSDNTATNLVLDHVGIDSVVKQMASLGCPETQIHSKVYRGDTSIAPPRSEKYGLGSTTADDMVRLFELLSQEKLVNVSASRSMLAHLRACQDRTKIAKHIPVNVPVAHKTGEVNDSRTDAALIDGPGGPLIVCVLTTDNKDRSWSDDNAANILCAEIGKAAYELFDDASSTADASPEPLRVGASGPLVEALQRTLNARLNPSPSLSVDGDFGGMTEAAVKRFQKEKQLPENGVVDKPLWMALGTLITEDEPVPDPDIVNKERLPKANRDEPEGHPLVTCKAWAVRDAETGQFLWGENVEARLDNASTTKVMTAVVVCREAEKDPKLWDELVVFSQKADDVEGSTAAIRAGETIPVSELLYGLLLPSGNDAAHALAEHVGSRMIAMGTSKVTATAGYDAFVDAMNATGKELGLQNSSFRNPHGLTQPDHGMTASDLTKLGFEAMKFEKIRQVTSTARRGYTIAGQEGYKRNLKWENTNQLLGIRGYDGIKTGTTDAAGACLVSRGWRDGKGVIIAVLGSQSSAARYIDTRNLYRWVWRTLAEQTREKTPARKGEIVVSEEAMRLHRESLVVDGHNDLPWNIRERSSRRFDKLDISQSQPTLHTDIARLRSGGLDAQFWSVWVPSSTAYDGTALASTLEQIDIVKAMMDRYPETFEFASTADDIDRIVAKGKIASLIGVEGGHSIENSLGVLHRLYERGARYMTLTHSDTLDWADSATDGAHHGGLTPFGEEVVREMNRLGMLVDISHVSEECMEDVLKITKAPVIFSHSSARAIADHPRNVPDAVLKKIPANGGLVMVNFYSGFIVPEAARIGSEVMKLRESLTAKYPKEPEKVRAEVQKYEAAHPLPAGTIYDVLDHIDHIVKLSGIDHVGLGSDFDGISIAPRQLDDVSCYPKLTQGLLDRGYSPSDIRKLLGSNLMRVFRGAEDSAKKLASETQP